MRCGGVRDRHREAELLALAASDPVRLTDVRALPSNPHRERQVSLAPLPANPPPPARDSSASGARPPVDQHRQVRALTPPRAAGQIPAIANVSPRPAKPPYAPKRHTHGTTNLHENRPGALNTSRARSQTPAATPIDRTGAAYRSLRQLVNISAQTPRLPLLRKTEHARPALTGYFSGRDENPAPACDPLTARGTADVRLCHLLHPNSSPRRRSG